MTRDAWGRAVVPAQESDDDTDGFLLDGFETVPGELLPFVEASRRRRARRRWWAAGLCGVAAALAAAAYWAT